MLSNLSKVLIVLGIILGLTAAKSAAFNKSDKYLEQRVLKLVSKRGACSGEQVKALSGVSYILTAAHCKVLADSDNTIMVITEDGKTLKRRIVAEDSESDLLLLEGVPGLEGISIAINWSPRQEVRTFTHGFALDTYKTSGVLIQIKEANVMVEDDLCKLGMSKYKTVKTQSFFGIDRRVCVMSTIDTVTTAMVVPGSSGGMVVDSKGDLIGVVSAGDGTFSYLVALSDIHIFVDNY